MWVALSILGSALRRNVWLNQGIYLLYPNMYVILVGPPGKTAKSTAIRLGRRLLQGVEDINFGDDSLTKQELIRQLAKTGGKNAPQSALTLHSTELSSLIEPSGISMMQFMTDIYDCEYNPKGWSYGTKGSGRDVISNPVLNILAGTTPSWLADGLPPAGAEHGFTARTIFVFEEEPRYLKPFPKEPPRELVNALINDIDHISRIEGEFEWGVGAKKSYEKIYGEIYESYPSDYRLESFHNRKKIHVLKLAMILSITEDDDLVIKQRDLEAAMDILDLAESNMPKAFSAIGKYEFASDLDRLEKRIITSGGIEIFRLVNEYRAVGDLDTLMKMIGQLKAARRIKSVERDDETFLIPDQMKGDS